MDSRAKQLVRADSYKGMSYKVIDNGGTFINVAVLLENGYSELLTAKRGDAEQVAKEYIEKIH